MKGYLIVLIIRLFAALPSLLTRGLTYCIGKLQTWLPGQSKSIIEKNLTICMPNLKDGERKKLVNKTIMQSAKLLTELPLAWCGSREQIKKQIVQVNHAELIEPYVTNKKPLIIAFPHLGNWEYVWHWMQINHTAIGIYRSAKIPQLDKLLLDGRQRFGGQAFAGDPKGLAKLLKSLKQGNIMGILPDQAPKGSGIYTPFFGKPAYTMTLVHKLIQKTDADLLLASSIRDSSGKGFHISFYPATFDTKEKDVNQFNLGLNQQLESIILKCPEQYQWRYKRFKRQEDHSDVYNDN